MTVLNNVGNNNATLVSSTGVGVAASTTLAAFQGWPLAAQVAFLNANGTGNPPQVVLGPTGGQQGLATLAADGTVDTEVLPDGFALAPHGMDEATFSSWSQDIQAAYMQANSADATSDGTTESLACGSGATAFTATQPVQSASYDPSDPATIQSPDVQVVTAATTVFAPVASTAGFNGLFAVKQLATATPPTVTGNALISSSLADLTTTGYTQADIPYFQVGSAAGDKAVADVAATIYTAASNTQPPSTSTPYALDPQTFEQWTTAQQYAYLESYISSNGLSSRWVLSIGLGSGNPIDVFISASSTAASPKIYIAQNLQKTDIAKMSFADQQMLTQATGYPALAAAYGLMPNASTPSTGATSATATIQALIASYRSTVTTSAVPPYVQSLFTAQIDLISAQLFGGALPSAPVAGTTTTVPTAPTLPSPQTGGSAIFSEKDIQAQLDAIQTRFKRVEAFAAQATLYNPPTVVSFDYTIDGDATGATYHYNYQQKDDSSSLYSHTDTSTVPYVTTYTTDTYVVALNPGKYTRVPFDYGPSSFLDFYRKVWPQNFDADAAGVHPSSGQFALSQTPNMTAHTFILNGKPVKVDVVSNIVIQNTQLGFNTIQGIYPLPASTDNDVTIRAGYEKFVAQEAAITANKMLAANLAQSGTLAGSNQSLDLPKLLCLYMMYNNNIQQAVVTADSEEVNQVNAVLQAYAAAQQVINATTATSTSNANDQLQLQYGVTNVEVSRFFETSYFYSTSPIEKMYFGNAWQRPLSTKFVGVAGDGSGGGGSDTANNWTQYGTRLSDTVTQINQQSQIKMNDVNSETKQQDRYFDLASTALSKLSDTLSQIASAT